MWLRCTADGQLLVHGCATGCLNAGAEVCLWSTVYFVQQSLLYSSYYLDILFDIVIVL